MDKPSLKNRLTGPALTAVATTAYHWLTTLNLVPVAVALLWPFVVWSAFIGGLYSALVAALVVGGYALWALPDQLPRATVILLGSVTIAVLTGVLNRRARLAEETRRKAEAMDALNGNVDKLHEARVASDSLLDNWERVGDEARQHEVRFIRHRIAEVLTVAEGWRELYREKEAVIADHEKGRKSGA